MLTDLLTQTGRLNFFPCNTLPPPTHISIPTSQLSNHGTHARMNTHSLGIIDVEKVRIQNRLQRPRHPGDLIHIALCKVSVQPVGDVERPVDAEREEVVRGDGVGFAGALEHEELWEDGDGFEPDGEGPEHLLCHTPSVIVSLHLT